MRVQKPARAALNVIVRIVRFEARLRVGEGDVSPGDDLSRGVVEGGLVGGDLHRAVGHFHVTGESIGILHLLLRIRENAHGVGRILESRRYRGLGLSSSCARRSSSRQGSHKKQHQAARPARPGFSRVPYQRLSGLHHLSSVFRNYGDVPSFSAPDPLTPCPSPTRGEGSVETGVCALC